MPLAKLAQTHWGFEETEDEKRTLADRLLRRKRGPKLTTEDMGGPAPAPLIAGRFAGPDLSLSAYLGTQDRVMPGHEPGAVERSRRAHEREAFAAVQRSPFVSEADEPVLGIGVQRSPFV